MPVASGAPLCTPASQALRATLPALRHPIGIRRYPDAGRQRHESPFQQREHADLDAESLAAGLACTPMSTATPPAIRPTR
jgi:hypothetical protein